MLVRGKLFLPPSLRVHKIAQFQETSQCPCSAAHISRITAEFSGDVLDTEAVRAIQRYLKVPRAVVYKFFG